jgi:hypothetical protein
MTINILIYLTFNSIMGACSSENDGVPNIAVQKSHFKFYDVIGKGGFGKAWH